MINQFAIMLIKNNPNLHEAKFTLTLKYLYDNENVFIICFGVVVKIVKLISNPQFSANSNGVYYNDFIYVVNSVNNVLCQIDCNSGNVLQLEI